MAAFLALFLAIALYLGYQHLEIARDKALVSDKTTANLLANFLDEHEKAVIGLLRSYATRSSLMEAIQRRNVPEASRHLADLKKNNEIDLTFITDPKGILWVNYPLLSRIDWYGSVVPGLVQGNQLQLEPLYLRGFQIDRWQQAFGCGDSRAGDE